MTGPAPQRCPHYRQHAIQAADWHVVDARSRIRYTGDLAEDLSCVDASVQATSGTGWALAVGEWLGHVIVAVTSPDGEPAHLLLDAAGPRAAHGIAWGDVVDLAPELGLLLDDQVAAPSPAQVEAAWARVARLHATLLALPDGRAPDGWSASRWRALAELAWTVFPDAEQATWRAHVKDARLAAGYAAEGFTPEQAAPWADRRIHAADSRPYRAAGWTPTQVNVLLHLTLGPNEGGPGRDAWLATGLPPRRVLLAVAAGLEPDETVQATELPEAALLMLAAMRDVDMTLLQRAVDGWEEER